MTKTHYARLSKRWKAKKRDLQKKLWSKHGDHLDWLSKNHKQLISGSLGGLMLLTGQMSGFPYSNPSVAPTSVVQEIDRKVFLISDLANTLPKEAQALLPEEEQKISTILSDTYSIKVVPELEGKRLNRTYGFIGQEQHLPRYPGDNLTGHFDSDIDRDLYWQQGMAPGLGAWSYFASSKEALTKEDKDKEKYYIAVQTFLSKDFNKRFLEYRNFYKYRKMLVVNPSNGRAIVADIADAGPAIWTGKQLGGSPEVMHYLKCFDGSLKSPVLYFFIDDPNDTIKLGPIEPLKL